MESLQVKRFVKHVKYFLDKRGLAKTKTLKKLFKSMLHNLMKTKIKVKGLVVENER